MRVTPLVLIQIFSNRMLADWPKCGSDPRDEGHLACLLTLFHWVAKAVILSMYFKTIDRTRLMIAYRALAITSNNDVILLPYAGKRASREIWNAQKWNSRRRALTTFTSWMPNLKHVTWRKQRV